MIFDSSASTIASFYFSRRNALCSHSAVFGSFSKNDRKSCRALFSEERSETTITKQGSRSQRQCSTISPCLSRPRMSWFKKFKKSRQPSQQPVASSGIRDTVTHTTASPTSSSATPNPDVSSKDPREFDLRSLTAVLDAISNIQENGEVRL